MVEPVSPVAPPLARPHLLRQRWCDVTFLHWAVDPAAIAHRLPPGVAPDVHDGRTYVGLVAFRTVGTGFAHGPAVPWLGTFLETNVRLYSVDAAGRRGTVFLSLDAERAAVVGTARLTLGLPYRWARMRLLARGDERAYAARLRWPGTRAESRFGVRIGGPLTAGPLEEFLTARWRLHVARLGRTWAIPTAHEPWPLRRAEVTHLDDGLLASVGLGALAAGVPDHVAFSDGVQVAFGFPRPAAPAR